mmetsp:Transcript_32687/g.49958  ORF Transcript_32687/g.49958 Transcript_32687/m.49958 type:complete len:92 (+) Transcript_32687:170-445(+)
MVAAPIQPMAAPEPTPEPSPPKSSLTQAQQDKIDAQLKEERRKQGERPPSEMAQALADDSMGPSDENPSGFVGKYLKKHRDMKLKAQEAVL